MAFLSYKYLEEHGFVCHLAEEQHYYYTFSKFNKDATHSISLVSDINPVLSIIPPDASYEVWLFGPTLRGDYSTINTEIVITTVEELETLMRFLNY